MNDSLIMVAPDQGDAVRQIMEKAPLPLREFVERAFQCIMDQDVQGSVRYCEKILAVQEEFPEIELLLAQDLYYLREEDGLERALSILENLLRRCPDDEDVLICLMKVHHVRGDYQKAVDTFARALPLTEYQPYAYQIYGDALEHLEREKDALAYYHLDLEEYEKNGEIFDETMLDGAFQKSLTLGVRWDADQFQRDLLLYKKFLLEAVTISEQRMQIFISDTVICMSYELTEKWLRRPFVEFLDFLTEHRILQGVCAMSVYTGYISAESYGIREDKKVSAFAEDYCSNVSPHLYNCKQAEIAGEESFDQEYSYVSKRKQEESEKAFLCYNYYMSRYYAGHEEELDYLKDHFPHTWEMVCESIKRIKMEPEAYREELLEKLQEDAKERGKPIGKEELRKSLDDMYERAIAVPKEQPVHTNREGTYRRADKKIGRNDPCPCGSGKKYKKCCGR